MNLTKLFEMQKVLKERIGYTGEDRFNKLILALLVELGECANEWRGFKFWSKDQEPRLRKERRQLKEGLELFDNYEGAYEWVPYNPLLEEYVDGVHFVLELGLDIGFKFSSVDTVFEHNVGVYSSFVEDVTEQFNNVYQYVLDFKDENEYKRANDEFEAYKELLYSYFGLGKLLGFTFEEIEQAYMDKNKVNHERQNNGY